MTMTMKQFYEYVATHADEAEVIAIAQKQLDKMNAKQAEKISANAEIIEAIKQALASSPSLCSASEIGAEIGQSTAKVASLLKGLRADGTVETHEDIKGNKVVRLYRLA